ncbi:MAG: glycoside hydrolase family 2 protein [Anaerolineae bacterium]|nr:glycoside hydrolase family 2 protein [Anaerolineae bacterium]
MQIQSLSGKWEFRQSGTGEWLPASVPGGVHTDLLALDRIPDPFVGDNEKQVMWVAETSWEYRHTFTVDATIVSEDKVFLACDGLDTLAEVMLNGQPLGKAGNMFRQYRWEVTDLLQDGENQLLIDFPSPVAYAVSRQAERPLKTVNQFVDGGPYLRKAPCQFGWDWGPSLAPIGIWQDIRLEGCSTARLDDIHLRQQHSDDTVTVSATVEVEQWESTSLTAVMHIAAPDGTEQIAQVEIKDGTATLSIPIEHPQLWWPNGYGEQPLYQVRVVLMADGKTCDTRSYQIGLRTIELRQEKDEWGTSFVFVVNGVPVFAKGSNWIPADSFPTRISDAHLEHLISSAAASHQNMLRVWGGGFYEEERFYDLCDKYGILVWQDFIFACSIYPLDETAFLDNLLAEVVDNVRRLRHRASLALWCGNNEMEWGWAAWGWAPPDLTETEEACIAGLMQRFSWARDVFGPMQARLQPLPDWKVLRDAYLKYFHTTLPAWVAKLDPDTPYWPSSPSSNTPFEDVNGYEQGDIHYWGVWHGREPFTAYRKALPRFVSEFGFQSLPPLETVKAFAEEADWNMTSYIMEHHQRGNHGNGLIIAQMTDTYRMPKDFPSLVYLSMVLQAEGIRNGVEHWRRNMQRVYGTLYWQLNDCWPVASWSSIDYFGRWKALHYAAKRFYAPLLLSVEDEDGKMGVHVTSDLQERWEGTVRWSLETLSGQTLAQGEKTVSAGPLASTHIDTLDFGTQVSDANRREVVFVCELWQGEERLALTVTPFIPSKHLSLTDPELAVDISLEGQRVKTAVTAASLARHVELSIAGADVTFDDNYFDLPAGRTLTVTCLLPDGWDIDQVRSMFRVRSLYDSFA